MVVNVSDATMIIKNLKPHLGDALMILAMMKDGDVYAGTPECNALLMNNVKTIPASQIVHWDVDVSDVSYPAWEDYAKALKVEWNGEPPKLIVSDVEKCILPETGKMRLGVCCSSMDKHRSYPHCKELKKHLSKYFDVYEYGREKLPIRQLVAEISQLDYMLSVDCGIAHIAGAIEIPLIVIQGPTDCNKLYNLYKDVTIIESPYDCEPCYGNPCNHASCMYLIKPQKICETIKSLAEGLGTDDAANALNLENKSPKQTQEKIVIVRMKGVGDVLMTWFGLEIVRKQNPDAHITYVTSENCSQLFYGQYTADKVVISSWDYPPEGIPRLPAEIRNIPHDRLIDLTNRVDFHDTIEKSLGDRKLLHTSPRADNFAKLMDVNLNGNVLHRMLNIPKEMDRWACKTIVQNDWVEKEDAGKLVCCQLDAKGLTRNWHIDRWMQLSQLLVEKGYGVIWFSTTPEHRYLKLKGVLNLACQTSLAQMIALMSKCQYAISTCSASIHIAHRLQKTIPVGIYGSTDYKLLAAYYDDLIPITNYDLPCTPCTDWGHECLGQPGAPWCINQISPKRIADAIQGRTT